MTLEQTRVPRGEWANLILLKEDPSAMGSEKGPIGYGSPTTIWGKGNQTSRGTSHCLLLLIIKIVLFIQQLMVFLVFILLIINKIIIFVA